MTAEDKVVDLVAALEDSLRKAIATGAQRVKVTTFTLGDMDYPHRVGDPTCIEGWCGAHGFPHPHEDCKTNPPGLVHANFGDEGSDGYWLYTKCDTCGSDA